MNNQLNILKGIHPGFALERELKKRGLAKGQFALSIREYPQTLSAIMQGRRNMNTALALRIEKELGIDEGFFMTLQVFYEIKEEKLKQQQAHHPDLSKFRPALFWDTKIDTINWEQQKKAIINRVFARGTISEKKEIITFYGGTAVRKALNIKQAA